jgi:hypothetical protein
LLDDGYRYYEIPSPTKDETRQMMIPQVNEGLLAEIRKLAIPKPVTAPQPEPPQKNPSFVRAMSYWKAIEAQAKK